MPDYSKTVIYKIVCNDLAIKDVYIGNTTDFKQRKSDHKKHCKNPNDKHYHYKIYKTIRDNGDWENWDMIEIEKFPCNDSNEAKKRQRELYEKNDSKLNTLRPMSTIEEKKKYHAEYHKKRNQSPTHKAKINEYNKANADKLKQYRLKYRLKKEIDKWTKIIALNSHLLNDKQIMNSLIKNKERLQELENQI
jgi:hypothetical protein